MWPGDARRLCVSCTESLSWSSRPCSLETVDSREPPAAVPMPGRRAWCGAVKEMPGPREGWPVLPDPFRHQGHLGSPDCPGGLDKGVWVEGTFWLGVGTPREKVGPKASLKRGGAVIWWQETKNSCFGRRRLWGWRHHSPPGCLRPLGVATLARHTPRPGCPLCCPPVCLEKAQSWVPAEMTLAYCIIYYSSPGRRTRF